MTAHRANRNARSARPERRRAASRSGFHLLELIVFVAIAALVITVAVPPLLAASSRMRLRLAAGEMVGVLQQARLTAVRFGANVGLELEADAAGGLAFRLYRDGDGDGLRRDDIESGVDPEIGMLRRLTLRYGVRAGFPPGPPPRDPSDPGRVLDRLDEPVRFGSSNLAVFTSSGTATPGSVFLTDGRRLVAVRVLNTTGRIRVLQYDPETKSWE